MTAIDPSLAAVLRSLGDALVIDPNQRDLRQVFEQAVQRVGKLREVHLRELPARYQARLVTPTKTADAVTLGVPHARSGMQAVIEASFEPGWDKSDASLDFLAATAQLAGLVLEASLAPAAQAARAGSDATSLIGSSSIMRALRERIERVAATDFTILVEGESGTGKELVARQLHLQSRRHSGPFVAINCAALVETLLEAELFGIEDRTATGVRGRRGKFEHADGGTLFLDEVSDLSLSAQAKLLRTIQDFSVQRVGGHGAHRVNTRIVAATNRPLSQLVSQGLFRSDLYYRLGGVEVHVPPLRVRREDIIELASHFLGQHRGTRTLTLSEPVVDALRLYTWPGNVRELQRLIERAVALSDSPEIELDDLPPQVRGDYVEIVGPSLAAGESLRTWASRYARLVYERCGRNKRRACRQLDISYHTLQAYLLPKRPQPAEGSLPAPSAPPASTGRR